MMLGREIWTSHESVAAADGLEHLREKVALVEPAGGLEIFTVVVPEDVLLCVLNPLPSLRVDLVHAKDMATDIPTSATCGWHESVAVGAPEPPGTHCHPVIQLAPVCWVVVVGLHEPLGHEAGSG
jgi:hypothetical protein